MGRGLRGVLQAHDELLDRVELERGGRDEVSREVGQGVGVEAEPDGRVQRPVEAPRGDRVHLTLAPGLGGRMSGFGAVVRGLAEDELGWGLLSVVWREASD